MVYVVTKLFYHDQLQKVGESLAEDSPTANAQGSGSSTTDDQEITRLYHEAIQEIGKEFEKMTEIAQAQTAISKTIMDPENEGYDVFLGVPTTPYNETDCDCKIILQERWGDKLCRTFYTINVGVDETGEEYVYEKQQGPRLATNGDDHQQKYDKMSQKWWIGAMRSDAYGIFMDVYNRIEEKESRAFACQLLTRCAREKILPVTIGVRAINNALEILDELADIRSASRALSKASSSAGSRTLSRGSSVASS